MTAVDSSFADAEPTAPNEAGSNRSFVRGSTLLFAGQILGNAGFFVSVTFLARGLGASDRGTMAFIVVATIIAARVSRVGVNEATIVFSAGRPELRPALLTNLLVSTAFTSAVAGGVVFASLYAAGGSRPAGISLTEARLLPVAIVAVALFEAGNQFLLGCSRFRSRAIPMMVIPWVYAAAILAMWLAVGLTVTRAVSVWIAMHVVWAFVVWRSSAAGIGFGRASRSLLSESMRFGARAWIGSLSDFLNFRTDQLLMGFLATQAALGVYAVAVNLSEVLLYLPDATAKALLPFVAARGGVRGEETLRAFRRLTVITAVTLALAAIVAPPLIPLLFGSPFRSSTLPFLLLLPGSLGFAALRVFSSALVGSSRPGLSSIPPVVSLTSGIALDFALIPRFGAAGAAAAASAAFIAGGIVGGFVYRSIAPFQLDELIPRRGDLSIAALRGVTLSLYAILRALVVRSRSLRWAVRRSRRGDGIRFLFYHRVSDDRDELAVRPDRFRAQMEFLAAEGYRAVDVVTAAELLRAGSPSSRTVCLSFDDGFRDVAENALPVLRELGFSATVFVSTHVVDGTTQFDWYDRQPPVLSWDEIRMLDADGTLRFEAHTLTHARLPHLSDEDAAREIGGSKLELEQALGRAVRAFCYPAGLLGARERRLVEEAGFEFATSCEPGINTESTDRLLLRRVQIDPRDRLLDFRAKAFGGHDAPPLARAMYRRLRYGVAPPTFSQG